MRISMVNRISALALLAGLAGNAFAAFPRNCEEALVLPVESIPVQARGEEQWDRASFVAARTECQRLAGDARRRLGSEFSVSTTGLSDLQVLYRLDEEVATRDRAATAAAAQREADAQRQREASDRAGEALAAQQLATGAELLRQQNETLRGLGVDLGGLIGGDDEEGDEDDESYSDDEEDGDIDPTELRMYRQMVDSGVAPQCRGREGAALIDCVDTVLDADDEE